MPDIPIELSAATLPVPVQIALVLAATIPILAIPVWLILGRARTTLQTPAELRDVRRVRRFLLYLVPFVLGMAVVVSILFISLEIRNALSSPPDSAPEDRYSDPPRLNNFPSEKPEKAHPNDAGDSVTDGPN